MCSLRFSTKIYSVPYPCQHQGKKMQLCLVQYTVIMFKRSTEIYAMNEICAPRNKAITLQNHGIADDEILNVYEFLNRTRFESVATIRR